MPFLKPDAGHEDLICWDILLVEDQPDVLDIHKVFLAKMRQRVHTARDGKSAYAMMQQNESRFDMVVTDYMMPEMDGLALTRAIREHDAELPVMIVTAFGEEAVLNDVKDSHTHVLSKPLSYQQLHAHMRHLQEHCISAEAKAEEAVENGYTARPDDSLT